MGKRERGEESLWYEEEDTWYEEEDTKYTWYEEEDTKYPGGGSSSLPSILLLTPRIIEALLCPLVLFSCVWAGKSTYFTNSY
jgi:hypothetical protein